MKHSINLAKIYNKINKLGSAQDHFLSNKTIKLFTCPTYKSGVPQRCSGQMGFNLIGLLIVVAIIAILASVTFIVIDPVKRFGDIDVVQKKLDMKSIKEAIKHYALENQAQSADIIALADRQPYMIVHNTGVYNDLLTCQQTVGRVNTATITTLVPSYLPSVPIDPDINDASVDGSGYYLRKKGNVIEVGICTDTYNLDTGLVGLWHIDDWVSGYLEDSSNNDNEPVFATSNDLATGDNRKVGKHGANMSDGDKIYTVSAVSGLPSGNLAKTIMTWAKYPTACNCTIGGFGDNEAGEGFQMAVTTGNFIVDGHLGVDWDTGIAASNYIGSWHHFALTYDVTGTITIFYIDGQALASTDGETWNTDPQSIAIGVNLDTIGQNRFTGQIDEFAIWERALSGDEISFIYNMQR